MVFSVIDWSVVLSVTGLYKYIRKRNASFCNFYESFYNFFNVKKTPLGIM